MTSSAPITAALPSASREPGAAGPLDLRLPALALVAWAAALLALLAPRSVLVLVAGCVAGGCVVLVRRGRADRLTLATWVLAGAGVAVVALVRVEVVRANPVATLAREQAQVDLLLRTTTDPVVRPGPFGELVLVRATVLEVTGRGAWHEVRAPVLVLGDRAWAEIELGSTVQASGRLAPPDRGDLAAVVEPRGPPGVLAPPGVLRDGAAGVRGGVRDAVAGQPPGPRTLVPALVAGDDAAMPPEITADFRTTGLTHLLAVSGTNLTLVVGALLLLTRWLGVRARGLLVIGLLGVVGFVLLARAEPSVVRAATMGGVALLAMGQHGRRHGTRALAAAVLLLLLWDPWWSVSPGFALSVLATAGILWLAPGWRDLLRRWLPRGAAEAIAVPLAAQVACTPMVGALSGEVSLVAVLTNLLAAPAVGPATVLGLAGGLLELIWHPLGVVVATPGAWCARWIIAVATWGADLPTAAVAWPADTLGLTLLTALSLLIAYGLGLVLARRNLSLLLAGVVAVVLVVPTPQLPTPGWPAPGWVMVACDVGQGDGLVLRTAAQEAIVVDAGPDPQAMQGCLRRLGVERVPLVLLSHFHADHVDGLLGVLEGREVGVVKTTGLAEPSYGVEQVAAVASSAGVPVREAAYGKSRVVGDVRFQVLAPESTAGLEGANDASVVLLVEVGGVRLLLLGDQEESSQRALLRRVGELDVDVVKVAHHGSGNHVPELLAATSPELAVVSVGADNDYGHPAPALLASLRAVGATVARTDELGDVAVVVEQGVVAVAARDP